MYGNIKKIFSIILIGSLLTSCGLVQKVTVKEEIHHIYRDSTILNIQDSIKVIPVERYVDIVPSYDTLHLQTSLAEATAFVDTSKHQLKGEIKNKKEFEQKTRIEYVYKTQIDSVYIKEPVPYEVIKQVVPKWCWWLLGINIGMIVALILWILKKYFKIFG